MNLHLAAILSAALCAGSLCLQGAGAASAPPLEAETLAAETRHAQGAAFLSRLRLADPDYRVIMIACLKENELNLLLSKHLSTPEIPILVKGLASQLGKAFPGQILKVVAFRPVLPLHEAAIARLDPATGEISYWGAPTIEKAR